LNARDVPAWPPLENVGIDQPLNRGRTQVCCRAYSRMALVKWTDEQQSAGGGRRSCGPGPPGTHPDTTRASWPPTRDSVQCCAQARLGPAPAGFAPFGHTAPPPRPDLGHGTGHTITPRHIRSHCRTPPPQAAPDTPPAPAPPQTAPSPPAPARSPPDHGSPSAHDALLNTWGRPTPRSRTPAPATGPTNTADHHHVARHQHAEPAVARALADPPERAAQESGAVRR
jgi:hypothetical protein